MRRHARAPAEPRSNSRAAGPAARRRTRGSLQSSPPPPHIDHSGASNADARQNRARSRAQQGRRRGRERAAPYGARCRRRTSIIAASPTTMPGGSASDGVVVALARTDRLRRVLLPVGRVDRGLTTTARRSDRFLVMRWPAIGILQLAFLVLKSRVLVPLVVSAW